MRVFDETKTNVLTEYDLNKGYLESDVIETDIPEQEAVEEVSHYETIREYPNGGKDVEKVIDVEGKPHIPAHTDTEDIHIYIPYTEDELEKISIRREIGELKSNLSATDYQAIKYAEGFISAEDYAPMRTQRQEWRDRINELENLLS